MVLCWNNAVISKVGTGKTVLVAVLTPGRRSQDEENNEYDNGNSFDTGLSFCLTRCD